jgi:hypothetical protein
VVETTVVVETEEDINIFSSYKKGVNENWHLLFWYGRDALLYSTKQFVLQISNQPVANLTRFISLWILSS